MTVTDTTPEATTGAGTTTATVAHPAPGGVAGALGTGDHKTIGRFYIATSLLFLLLSGVVGALVGAERVDTSRLDVLGQDSFFQVFTLHSISAVFLFLLPLLVGLAMVLVPLQVGASTVAFPRAAALSYWGWLVSGGILVASYAMNGGPFGADANGVDLFLLSLVGIVTCLLLATVCIVTTVLTLRTTGMTLDRVPLFSWSMLVAGTVWLLSLPVLAGGAVLLYVGLHYGVAGDSTGVYRAMKWAFQQPQLYAFAAPALGIAGDVAATFARTRLPQRQRQAAMAAIGLAGALGFGAWAQRTLPRAGNLTDQALYIVVAFAAVLPFLVVAGVVADTLRRGRPLFRSPLVFVVASLLMLLAGAAAGAVSSIDVLDLVNVGRGHADTTWMTAQAHYVLLGVAIAAIGGAHFWAPKLFGRELREGAGILTALLLLLGTVALAVPDLVSGALDQLQALDQSTVGLPIRDGVEALNTVSFVGGLVVALGALVFVVNVLAALPRRAEELPADPLGVGQTLEWATLSPPPAGNFAEPPTVLSAEPLLDERDAAEVPS